MAKTNYFYVLIAWLLLLFATLTYAFPMIGVFSDVTWGSLQEILRDDAFGSALRVSCVQTSWSTALSLVLGCVTALVLDLPRFRDARLRRNLHIALQTPFVVPSVTAAFAWLSITGSRGLTPIVIAHVFFNAPFVAHAALVALERVPTDRRDLADVLELRGSVRLRRVQWPALRSIIMPMTSLVAALCMASFSVVLLLGGGPPIETLETSLYSKALFSGVMGSSVAALAFAQWIVVLLLSVLPLLLNRNSSPLIVSFEDASAIDPGLRASRGSRAWGLWIAWAWSLPYAYFLLKEGVLWKGARVAFLDAEIWLSIFRSIEISVLVALSAAMISWASASLSARWKVAHALALAPVGLSTLVLGVALLQSYGRAIDPVQGSLWLVIALQTALFWPIGHRMFVPFYDGQSAQREDLVRVLGLSARERWRAEWARLRAPFFKVASIAGASAVGELGAASLFYGEEWMPAPFFATRLMGQYRFDEANFVAALLLALSMIWIALGSRLSMRYERGDTV